MSGAPRAILKPTMLPAARYGVLLPRSVFWNHTGFMDSDTTWQSLDIFKEQCHSTKIGGMNQPHLYTLQTTCLEVMGALYKSLSLLKETLQEQKSSSSSSTDTTLPNQCGKMKESVLSVEDKSTLEIDSVCTLLSMKQQKLQDCEYSKERKQLLELASNQRAHWLIEGMCDHILAQVDLVEMGWYLILFPDQEDRNRFLKELNELETGFS
ncbi:hypothetical protein [Crucivirus-429]|nr:hypothetical protein [Crucivirus-429]